jgi:hypothetical protein
LLAPTNADVDDALEGERKSVGSMFVKLRRVERRYRPWSTGARGKKAIDCGWIFWRWRREAEVVEELDQAFESTVHRHDFADPRRR